jgi:AmmeMemoRadiSam system protein A
MYIEVSETRKKELLYSARREIADHLRIHIPEMFVNADDPLFVKLLGAFVTIHIGPDLRGCIGYIKGVAPLLETVREMALSAAFHDPRFVPLSEKEYPEIDIEISVLSPISPLVSFENIVIGRDGLIAHRDGRTGLLLPQVAEEQGWKVEEFISHTCMKAGLHPDSWRDGSVKFETFSATVFGEKSLSLS